LAGAEDLRVSLMKESILAGTRLCVAGNINRDIKTAPFPAGEYLFRDGETSLTGVRETLGGGGANSAAIAAALGAQSMFVGQIGEDPLGARLQQTLERHGVACRLNKVPGLVTGTTVNLVFDTGQRHFLSCLPNNAALRLESLDLTDLKDADHLLRADIWFSEAMLFGGNEQLFRIAREAGVATSIDLNWDPQWGRAPAGQVQRRKEAVRSVLPLVDVAHGNIRELTEFADAADAADLPGAVARLLEWGVGGVAVHMGAQGSGWFTRSECIVQPAALVSEPTVATGTGDVFSVCLMLLHHRHDIAMVDKLRLANGIVAEFMQGKRTLIPELT
jgi:sugar/nucleoside kinase (ribokinase family)